MEQEIQNDIDKGYQVDTSTRCSITCETQFSSLQDDYEYCQTRKCSRTEGPTHIPKPHDEREDNVAKSFLKEIRQARKEKWNILRNNEMNDHNRRQLKEEYLPYDTAVLEKRKNNEKALQTKLSENYLTELGLQYKTRTKLVLAKERWNNVYDAKQEGKYDNNPLLISKVNRRSTEGSLSRAFGEMNLKTKDENSMQEQLSEDTIQSLNDGSLANGQTSGSLKQTRPKIRSNYDLSFAWQMCKELQIDYTTERKRQLELLEVIRQLQGVNKNEFYNEIAQELDSDTSTGNNKNDRFDQKFAEIVKDMPERELSPIANQLPTPDPSSDESSRNVTPEPDIAEPETPKPEIQSSTLTLDTTEEETTDQNESQESVATPSTVISVEINSVQKEQTNDVGKRDIKFNKLFKVDSRWPKGHKHHTKPAHDKYPVKAYKTNNSCYLQDLSMLMSKQKRPKLNNREQSNLKSYQMTKSRQRLMRNAYRQTLPRKLLCRDCIPEMCTTKEKKVQRRHPKSAVPTTPDIIRNIKLTYESIPFKHTKRSSTSYNVKHFLRY